MSKSKSHSVLIVEDEQIVALDIQQMLEEFGYDAFAVASTADEAIARASERRPDLVLMDIRIKGKRDGIEAADLLRERFSIPVVFLTAHSDEGTLDRAKKVEPFGYVVKPVRAQDLRIAIELALYRHEIEARLRERERWFSTTLLSIGDAVLAVDLAGRTTFMNPAAEALTGIDAGAAIGKPVQEILQLADRPAEDESPVLTALREERLVTLDEGRLRNLASGAFRVISDSAAPVMLDEQVLGAVMVFRDITEQRKIQKRLEVADRLLSLGTMAAGVAHEINNPLTVIIANAGFLAEDLSALTVSEPREVTRRESMVATLGDLQSAADRVKRIVSDLRVFAQPDVKTEETDIRRCIEWAVRATAHELRHRATVTMEIAAVPHLNADEMKLGQVLVNLLINAAHAIPPGNVEANQVTVTARTDPSERVVIEVRDTGSGIPADVLEHVFEPFVTTKAPGHGTGLGLSICHGIIAALGGQIEVESEVGKGTAFRVFLPASVPPASAPEPPARNSEVKPIRGRILVVDDEELILRLLMRVLREHEVHCTTSARVALDWIAAGQTFDLVLSDLLMPSMTGMAFYETLLVRHPELASRVIFMTGGTVTPLADAFLQSVPNLHLEKPFEIAALLRVVQAFFAERTAAGAGDA